MTRKNGFVMYAESRRSELMAAGLCTTGSLYELVPLCSDGWLELSSEERQAFNDKAKQYNEEMKAKADAKRVRIPTAKGKKSSKKIAEEEAAARKEVEYLMGLQNNRKIVERIFERKQDKEFSWMTQPIVICSFSLYVEPGYQHLYLPAEIGLTAFSLADGVLDNFARIIDPSPVPKGYGIEAMQMSGRLGVPEIGSVPEFSQFEQLIISLEEFLRKYNSEKLKGDTLHVFAFDSDYQMVTRCLEWLFEKTQFHLGVKVLSLNQFTYLASVNSSRARDSMREEVVSRERPDSECKGSVFRKPGKPLVGSFMYPSTFPSSSYGIFINEIDVEPVIKGVDNYKYYEELCCIYHIGSGKEIQNCSLNLSNRYAFSILEYLTLSNDIVIIAGKHYPEIENPLIEKKRRVRFLQRWGITSFETEMLEQVLAPREENTEELPATRHSRPRTRGIHGRQASIRKRQYSHRSAGEARGEVGQLNTAGNETLAVTYENKERRPHQYTGPIPSIFYGGNTFSPDN